MAQPKKHKDDASRPRLNGKGVRFGIVVSRFNSHITDGLLKGAMKALAECKTRPTDVTVVHVPGAWEIPLMAQALAETEGTSAVICLACVIRGETAHFDIVAGESSRGIAQVALNTSIPVTNGILACDTEAQAKARSGDNAENKGREAALAAVEMAQTLAAVRAHCVPF